MIIVSTAATPEEAAKRMETTATTARVNVANHAESADDLRDLGLMLGLLDRDENGVYTTSTPWDAVEPLGPEIV